MKPLEEMGKFATVVIDPPWPLNSDMGLGKGGLKKASVGNQYSMISMQDIEILPISEVLIDDALLFCWTINKYLPFTFDLLKAWGLKYSFTMTWVKKGGIQTPVTPMFNAEWVVVGRKGKPKYLDIKAFKTANQWPRRKHSEKPEEFYELLRRVTPSPRLDVFGRRRIAGFQSWGNEAPEEEVLPDHYQQVLL